MSSILRLNNTFLRVQRPCKFDTQFKLPSHKNLAFKCYAVNSQTIDLNGSTSEPQSRVFANFTVYKGKSALCVSVRKPLFSKVNNGNFTLVKEGGVRTEFAQSFGPRQYDWQKKQVFSLSVLEIGSILVMEPNDQLEFFHDPQKGMPGEGLTTKTFRISPMKDGYFFNLNVRNKGQDEVKINVPVSKAEFAVMKSSFNYILPFAMGWQAVIDPRTIDEGMLDRDDD